MPEPTECKCQRPRITSGLICEHCGGDLASADATAGFTIPAAVAGETTIAQDILSQVAQMRKRGEMNQALCWSPEELERLAMFAVDAKNRLAREQADAELCASCALNTPDVKAWQRVYPLVVEYARSLDAEFAAIARDYIAEVLANASRDRAP